jgi:hypothetical protein
MLVEIDGGVYWMLSHPRQAATVTAGWFADTLTQPGATSTTRSPAPPDVSVSHP